MRNKRIIIKTKWKSRERKRANKTHFDEKDKETERNKACRKEKKIEMNRKSQISQGSSRRKLGDSLAPL